MNDTDNSLLCSYMLATAVVAQYLPLLSTELINVHDLAIEINALEVAKDPDFFVDGDILAHGFSYLSLVSKIEFGQLKF